VFVSAIGVRWLRTSPYLSVMKKESVRAIIAFLLVFLLANGLRLFVVGLLPAGIGVVFVHRFGDDIGLFAEILLIHHSILANDECHSARLSVFPWVRRHSETFAHLAVYDVAFRAAWAILPLTRQDAVKVAAIRTRSAVL